MKKFLGRIVALTHRWSQIWPLCRKISPGFSTARLGGDGLSSMFLPVEKAYLDQRQNSASDKMWLMKDYLFLQPGPPVPGPKLNTVDPLLHGIVSSIGSNAFEVLDKYLLNEQMNGESVFSVLTEN